MHISKVLNQDDSCEIYFEELNYWEEFELISTLLEKENNCTVIKKKDAVYIRENIFKKDSIQFSLKHDSILGNFLFTTHKKDSEFLEKLASNIVNSIKTKLNNNVFM